MRALTWHFDGSIGGGTALGPVYRLDGSYTPRRAWLHLKRGLEGDVTLKVDLNVDGTSIFQSPVQFEVQKGETDVEETDFSSIEFSEDSQVTLDIDQPGEVRDMTVGLELDEA